MRAELMTKRTEGLARRDCFAGDRRRARTGGRERWLAPPAKMQRRSILEEVAGGNAAGDALGGARIKSLRPAGTRGDPQP